MRNRRVIAAAIVVVMMAATAGWLHTFSGRIFLQPPGVKIADSPMFGQSSEIISPTCVPLPEFVLGADSGLLPVTTNELDALPKDTTFGRRYYTNANISVDVVLMGTDHTSIHEPQYCLYAQDFNVTNTERITLHMTKPFAYDVPAVKMTAAKRLRDGHTVVCYYVYWFVCADKITSAEGTRLWSMWKTMLTTGKLERWAYISYLTTCLPGGEAVTFRRLQRFIEASAPEFQTVTGPPTTQKFGLAAEKQMFLP